jgi:hypothetical protein
VAYAAALATDLAGAAAAGGGAAGGWQPVSAVAIRAAVRSIRIQTA